MSKQILLLIVFLAATSAASAASAADCAKTDLICRGERGVAWADTVCPDRIERLATYSVRWTDKFGSPKFSKFNWTKEPGGPITYIGDRVEFQTPQGAYMPMRYLCDMAEDGKKALSARAYPGRLPVD